MLYRKQRRAVALSQIFKGYSSSHENKPPYWLLTKYSVEFLRGCSVPYLGYLSPASGTDSWWVSPNAKLRYSKQSAIIWGSAEQLATEEVLHYTSQWLPLSVELCPLIRLPLPPTPSSFFSVSSLKKSTTNNFLGLVEPLFCSEIENTSISYVSRRRKEEKQHAHTLTSPFLHRKVNYITSIRHHSVQKNLTKYSSTEELCKHYSYILTFCCAEQK